MEEKEWKSIPGFPTYMASTDGELKTFNWKGTGREAIMKPAKDGCGYLRTMLLSDGGKYCTIKVHRIIALTFIPNPENKPTVNHKNGIKTDNRVENLEWATASENIKHAFKSGLMKRPKGELNPACNITEKEVLEIRSLISYGKKARSMDEPTKKELAEKYGVKIATIKGIVTRKTWKHLL